MIEILMLIVFLGLVYLLYLEAKKPQGGGGPPSGGFSAA